MNVRFDLPADLSASAPPEARGLARDEVRLLVASPSGVHHTAFRSLGEHLRPGDVLVVNTSGTLPAAIDALRAGRPVVVHFATSSDDGSWIVELRAPGGPLLDGRPGERLALAGDATLTLLAPVVPGVARLWRASVSVDVRSLLEAEGRPIRYGYVPRAWPLAAYQTAFAREPGSAEMPSAARPFTPELVTRLVTDGVLFAPLLLHTGVSSPEAAEPPQAERFRVPSTTAALVSWVRERGGRVIAVGTTAARALESAASGGELHAASGWTELVLGPDRPARVVDGIVTGLHAPEASHLLLLEAVAGAEVVQRAYDAAVEERYLWHEFGDVSLLLRH
ncbi:MULTISPECIES: S-adenosylmethionine:tRNA ribosyltransferase-isomerase [unclassified Amycolatopsis]|uniref:S-adenosylmethionine:tRNA ribosyltransferase-isomerase n=1 Tax=unclassified Amycolatopsis TaxID=2618356 RepID=UPI002876B96C|nr:MULTISPECIES: S-adenosylmethionine:tRNA ribosyltransferase-isomerase [unclassified Amycolatopsis]MDS0140691.1 S-adenosylmethionine:tRNA ribosyltransferase-isomerase [Amycolatopsis sp. 505]MDS0149341.1 S-adenosylmethionine:tRNA ribosyltransferase-isomerase [Amycolatopsis sp. CM201R]